MARPTKYTPAIADEIVAGIATGLTDKDAAAAAGIHPDSLANWTRRYSGFSARITRARAQRARMWLGAIRRIAEEERDWRAYAELLDRCAPEYRKVQKSEQTITLDVRQAAEKVAADLGVPVDVVLAETFRMTQDEA